MLCKMPPVGAKVWIYEGLPVIWSLALEKDVKNVYMM